MKSIVLNEPCKLLLAMTIYTGWSFVIQCFICGLGRGKTSMRVVLNIAREATFAILVLFSLAIAHFSIDGGMSIPISLTLYYYIVLIGMYVLAVVFASSGLRSWRSWEEIPASEIRVTFMSNPEFRQKPLFEWFWSDSRSIRQAHAFHCIREYFIELNQIRTDFPFGEYISECLSLILVQSFRSSSWLGITLFPLFYIIEHYAPQAVVIACLLPVIVYFPLLIFSKRSIQLMQKQITAKNLLGLIEDMDDMDYLPDTLATPTPKTPSLARVFLYHPPMHYRSVPFPLDRPNLVHNALKMTMTQTIMLTAALFANGELFRSVIASVFICSVAVMLPLWYSVIVNYTMVRYVASTIHSDILRQVDQQHDIFGQSG